MPKLLSQTKLDKLTNKEWLIDQFVIQEKSIVAIAKDIGVSHSTARGHMQRLGIDTSNRKPKHGLSRQIKLVPSVTVAELPNNVFLQRVRSKGVETVSLAWKPIDLSGIRDV